MAIKVKKGDSYLYRANEGVLNTPGKIRADHIYEDAVDELKSITYVEKDALGGWYKRGVVANRLIVKHKIDYEEKKFFWVMLYDAAGMEAPKKSYTARNDFRTASVLAGYRLSDLRKVGSWGLWREVVGSNRIISDERVAAWVTEKIIKDKISRDNARPLLRYVRNRLKGLDTSVLSPAELFTKLNSGDLKELNEELTT
jgi:hypothetical protein